MRKISRILVGAAVSAGLVSVHLAVAAAADIEGKTIASEALPNAPGQTLTAVILTFAPGAKSAKHHHAGSVFVYVLSGTVRSENSATGPAQIYKAGQTFFEPPGSEHLISENASSTEPATVLAIHIAGSDAELTTFDDKQ
jgi:quercetin dioxygenase-like cupin family protein